MTRSRQFSPVSARPAARDQRRDPDPCQPHADDDGADGCDVGEQRARVTADAHALVDALQLEAEQDEERDVEAEDEHLPERHRAQARVGVEHLVRVPAEPDAGCDGRQHPREPELLGADVCAVGEQDREEDRQRNVRQAAVGAHADPGDGEADRDAAGGRGDEVQRGAGELERARRDRGHRHAVGDEGGGVVEHRLGLDGKRHALGDAEAAEHRRRRHRVGRRKDRAQHERRRPAQPVDDRVRDHRYGAHRHEHEGERQRHELPGGGAQLLRRGVEARRVQQRRQEDEEDGLRREADVGQARDEADRDAADDEHDRIGNRHEVGEAHEHRRGEQDRDEELDVAHDAAQSTNGLASTSSGRVLQVRGVTSGLCSTVAGVDPESRPSR